MERHELRRRIDGIDDEILELLARRLELAQELGEDKRENNEPIYDPRRERDIVQRLWTNNRGRLDPAAIQAVWREIFSSSRQAQLPIRVAYLGPEGTFTQQAALARFGSSAQLIASQTISSAFSWVESGTVEYAVLPVENTLQGIVGETVDLLGAAGKPLIIGEIVLEIHFVFSSRRENLADIKRIYSKQEAFPQCSAFLNQPALENARRVAVASTAEATRQAAEDEDGAALSSEIAATLAGVPVLFRHVENNTGNKTRFLILGRERPAPTGDDKTSVFAKVPHVAGGLGQLLDKFKRNHINMTKIDSRPMYDAANFETWFYIDFDGHVQDTGVAALMAEHNMVWLGSYPRFRTDGKK